MRIPLAVAAILSVVGCSHAPLHQTVESIVGLWQFPERGVWVEIDADGSTFQCRVAPSGTVFMAKGHFITDKSILWSDIWGVDQVRANENSITLQGKWGAFTYVRATTPMNSACSTSDEA